MKPLREFTVVPRLPEKLESLREIAQNLWWSWDHEAISLFRRLDSELWETAYHNPIYMLGLLAQERLEAAAKDEAFLAHLDVVYRKFKAYMSTASWFEINHSDGDVKDIRIAYFSAEFGLTECMPLYSGGLGVLAGDYLKAPNYLGLPLVGVGLLYQHGYFRQQLTADGVQKESYPLNDFHNMPIQLERRADGSPVVITVDYPEGKAHAQIWRAQISRTPLYLLDTNLAENTEPTLRDITDYLYGGDVGTRMRQEILLGVGGYHALIELGIRPTVCHMNEGHSAFLAIERIRHLMEEENLSFDEARETTVAGNIFTTHTPVHAGMDVFPPDLIDSYLSRYYDALGISRDEFLALGRDHGPPENGFSMAVLALRLSVYCNGVSHIHGGVSRNMWKNLWPGLPEAEVPIQSITNGIHIRSWVSNDMQSLFDRYLGPLWMQSLSDQSVWTQVDRIPETELWRTHERRRERLVTFARQRLKQQLTRVGASSAEVRTVEDILNPEALTIGFARRFTSYKRATLLFQDLDRLAQILNHPIYPVQIIFAGKAHPHDDEGKLLIQRICEVASEERFRYQIVFIEDYDMCVARNMVQGVDVWLNTPLPPLEASGTSGMKAAANGVLNFSILDGWWAEGCQFGGGWTIGNAGMYEDQEYQNEGDADAIYHLLEQEIIPMFYDRGRDAIPHQWVDQMKMAMRSLSPRFNTNRMVSEYANRFYFPAHRRWKRLNQNGVECGKALGHWKSHVRRNWSEIRIECVEDDAAGTFAIDKDLSIKVQIHLGSLSPNEVSVQIYHGLLDEAGEISCEDAVEMACTAKTGEATHLFAGTISSHQTGLHGYTLRVLPQHANLNHPYEPGLIFWAT